MKTFKHLDTSWKSHVSAEAARINKSAKPARKAKK